MNLPPETPPPTFEARVPAEMAVAAEHAGIEKAGRDALTLLALAVLAGAFIGLGAMFSTAVSAGMEGTLGYGLIRLIAGLAFSLGLILVIVGGAELFTGDTLIVMAWAAKRVRTLSLLRVWLIVYVGNFVGAVATAAIIFGSGHYEGGGGAVGKVALNIARAKLEHGFGEALALGVIANVLVCLAVWMCFSARTTTGKVMVIVPPIAAFVAGGFEHSIANMYFVPMALFIEHFAPDAFWSGIGATAADYAGIGVGGFLLNLISVTIGNIIGGGVLVAGVYWFIYLRRR